jgi:subtilase family serine protease
LVTKNLQPEYPELPSKVFTIRGMKKASRGLQAFPVAVLTLFAFVSLLPGFTISAAAQRQPVITAIDDSDRVTLHHTTHALATPSRELSPAEPTLRMERMLLLLGPSEDLQPQVRALIDSQHDKKSASFHKWLTPEQFGERFGPAQQDIDALANWLQQKGFDSIKPARGRGTIEFSGTAGAVQQAFGTQMNYYQFKGEKHLANSSDISIPRAMSGIVRGVNLQNFTFSKPSLVGPFPVARNSSGKLVRTDPDANSGNGATFSRLATTPTFTI